MPVIKMFMGTRENFENKIKKDGIEECAVYLNKDTGELYFVYDNKLVPLVAAAEEVSIMDDDLCVDAYNATVRKYENKIPDTFAGSSKDWEDIFKPLEISI